MKKQMALFGIMMASPYIALKKINTAVCLGVNDITFNIQKKAKEIKEDLA